jgi:hypothetical protein
MIIGVVIQCFVIFDSCPFPPQVEERPDKDFAEKVRISVSLCLSLVVKRDGLG